MNGNNTLFSDFAHYTFKDTNFQNWYMDSEKYVPINIQYLLAKSDKLI